MVQVSSIEIMKIMAKAKLPLDHVDVAEDLHYEAEPLAHRFEQNAARRPPARRCAAARGVGHQAVGVVRPITVATKGAMLSRNRLLEEEAQRGLWSSRIRLVRWRPPGAAPRTGAARRRAGAP